MINLSLGSASELETCVHGFSFYLFYCVLYLHFKCPFKHVSLLNLTRHSCYGGVSRQRHYTVTVTSLPLPVCPTVHPVVQVPAQLLGVPLSSDVTPPPCVPYSPPGGAGAHPAAGGAAQL